MISSTRFEWEDTQPYFHLSLRSPRVNLQSTSPPAGSDRTSCPFGEGVSTVWLQLQSCRQSWADRNSLPSVVEAGRSSRLLGSCGGLAVLYLGFPCCQRFIVGSSWVKFSSRNQQYQRWKSSKWVFCSLAFSYQPDGDAAPKVTRSLCLSQDQNHFFKMHFLKQHLPLFSLQPFLVSYSYLITLHALMMKLIDTAACLCHSSCNTVWSCPVGELSTKQKHDIKACLLQLSQSDASCWISAVIKPLWKILFMLSVKSFLFFLFFDIWSSTSGMCVHWRIIRPCHWRFPP